MTRLKTQDNCGRVLSVTVPVERVIQSAHKIGLTPHVNVLAHQFVQSHGGSVHFSTIPTHIGERDTGSQIT